MRYEELLNIFKPLGNQAAHLKLKKSGFAHTPYVDMNTHINRSDYMACLYKVYHDKERGQEFVAVLSHHGDQYFLRCSDPYLEGRLSEKSIQKMIEAAFEKVASKNEIEFTKLLKGSYKIVPTGMQCGMHGPVKSSEKVCEHMRQFLFDLDEAAIGKLQDEYKSGFYGGSKSLESLRTGLPQLFHRYAFKKPILLEGDKGSGKTHFVMNWGLKNKVSLLFVGGHEQFESIDFLGHYIPQKDKTLVWKDGPLTQAFRKAAKGEKVLLVIDEMLRIPQRELNILVAALAPISDHYILRTGRAKKVVDEIAQEETLFAPKGNLWIVGTTNVGVNYAVDEIDSALADRFKTIRKDTRVEELEAILSHHAKKRNFSQDVITKLMAFYTKMEYLLKSDELTKIVNIRHLSEAIEFAENEDRIVDVIYDTILTWVDRDLHGRPDREQVQLIEMAIGRVWGIE